MAKNLKQLLAQIDKLQAQADALKSKERVGVIARIQEAIAHYALTSEELFSKPARKAKAAPSKPATRKKAPAAAKKAVGQRKYQPGKPKYHDGTGRSWTGQGKRPGWFVEAIEAGKTAESMLINAGEA